jgi:hypothetical protein
MDFGKQKDERVSNKSSRLSRREIKGLFDSEEGRAVVQQILLS